MNIHLDLFSGIGGFSLAAKWAGFQTIQFVENDLFCQKVLTKNFPNIPIHDDIKTFQYNKSVTLLTGGFPCQSFSIAGKQKGINDERYLWSEMFRIIRECKPTWIIAENVTGIVEMALEEVCSNLENENYETQTFIIPACAANAPHRRDRVWIIAHALCERCGTRFDTFSNIFLQANEKWVMETYQKEWLHLQPDTWETFSAQDRLLFNTRSSRGNDGLSRKLDINRIKSLGNAIVPQVVYPLMKIISRIDLSCSHRDIKLT
jgi:DNA (cytosine-5)-methyltransferase 1